MLGRNSLEPAGYRPIAPVPDHGVELQWECDENKTTDHANATE